MLAFVDCAYEKAAKVKTKMVAIIKAPPNMPSFFIFTPFRAIS